MLVYFKLLKQIQDAVTRFQCHANSTHAVTLVS